MSKSEENQSVEAVYGTPLLQPGTALPSHEGEDGMGSRSMTVGRYEEIRRRLADGRGVREIARALNCSRDTMREVRDGTHGRSRAHAPIMTIWLFGGSNSTGRMYLRVSDVGFFIDEFEDLRSQTVPSSYAVPSKHASG